MAITPFSGLFRGGKVSVSMSINACDGFTCELADTTRSVQLRGGG
jgi:hypothetical protein